MKTVINNSTKYLVKEDGRDFHCEFGVITKEELTKERAKTNTGVEFAVFEPTFIDLYEKLSRQAQIITLKDIGTIIAETGINNKSIVIDAGAGSGALCCSLANICKKVISYEIREDHLNVAKKNADMLGLKNIKFKIGDVREKIEEKDVDLIVLDMPDPWNAIKQAVVAIKHGGFLVLYSPTIPQVMDTVNTIKTQFKDDLVFLKTIENIQRPWEVDERKVRPQSSFINHTGFLTFIRRI